ncbi:MAG: MFS transporter, partial [Christensenellales bacterium]
STVFNVPYLSLTSEISQDTKERSLMNFARTACGMLASALIFVVSSELFGKAASMSTEKFSWTIILVFGFMFAIPILCSAIFTKERTPLPEHKSKFSVKTFTNTFKLKCFRRLLLMYVFSFICNEIIASIIITYVYNVAGGADITVLGFQLPTVVNICMLGGAGLIMPVVLIMIAKKVPKPVIFMCGVPMFLGGAIGLACFPANASDPRLMMIPALIAGLGFGMAQVVPWLTFPDVVDVAELKSNDRNPGAYNSTMTFFKKFSSGLAVFLVGLVLETTGYDESLGTDKLQPQSAITGMRLVLGICISAFLIIAFVGAFLIKITTKKSERVTYFISKQRAGELDTLDEQEQAELENLKKELF